MKTGKNRRIVLVPMLVCTMVWTISLRADDPPAKDNSTPPAAAAAETPSGNVAAGSSTSASGQTGASSPQHAAILKDAKPLPSGLLTLYQKGNNLYAELSSSDYGAEYIVLISIARGISFGQLIGGYSWSMGDDWLWTFRKIDDRVHIVRSNVRFKANAGFPESVAVRNAYTDSVLFSLPIMAKGPKGGDLVNLSQVFMSDLPRISDSLPGFMFSPDRSTWGEVKVFDRNVELEVAATYASGGRMEIETVPDSRGASINVHYSISKLPASNYQPRLADDRVGYFLTAVKDFNKQSDRDQFVRYINRWHLERPRGAGDGPTAPDKKIRFYIEKTVPYKYRPVIREAILEWNKALAKAGWIDAIEVIDQQDGDTWDPEDINYNTFRWITANAGFAMGPSRVNPRTGQILDADIIFDADFLTFWKEEFETMSAPTALVPAQQRELPGADRDTPAENVFRSPIHRPDCHLTHGMSAQLAFGSACLAAAAAKPEVSAAEQEKLIMQGLKEVAMHEVGHTLGLRHNFKGSKLYRLNDLNDAEKVKDGAIVASVMDYSPTNIVPKGGTQGHYYASTIGPYDYWAIEYGYKSLSGGTTGELAELQKIAARSGEPALAYATDEDTSGNDPDPDSNLFDLGADGVEYARQRAQLVKETIPTLVERLPKEGEDFTQVRRALGALLSEYGQAMHFAARYVGGLSTSRSHKGDKDAKPPISPVDAKQQREALALLEECVFSDQPFQFPHDLYAHLGTTRWRHWGMNGETRKDFPAHSVILMWQGQVLDHLLATNTLERIHDTELKVPADVDVLTTAELLERLTRSIFSELETIKEGEFDNRRPAISSLRRNLQRDYLQRLSRIAMGGRNLSLSFLGIAVTTTPSDCQTIAYSELSALESRMNQLLKSNVKLDSYTRAHLQESASRIQKVLDARLTLSGP